AASHAWTSARTGQKNFERAWSAFMFKRTEPAMDYFVKAADSFGAGLAEEPPSRTTMFPSNLTMAGMSLYYAGRHQEVAAPMEMVMTKDDRVWEAPFFTALACARLGDEAGTIDHLTLFLKTSPAQPILANAVIHQLEALKQGQGSLADTATTLEQAAFDQFDNNITFIGVNASNPQDACDGNYWWRYSRSPCPGRNKYTY
ncbi:MAG: hypothetical protein KKD85_10010, partial [Proteobacteria bacterium]|nr:hypothetical protein [Pseudomonadota bacterium]